MHFLTACGYSRAGPERPLVGALVAVFPQEGQRDELLHCQPQKCCHISPRRDLFSSFFNHVPGRAVLDSCKLAHPFFARGGERKGERFCVPRALQGQGQLAFHHLLREMTFSRSLPLFMPVVLEKDGPLVFRLCSSHLPLGLTLFASLLRSWGQKPSDMQNIW